jgi:MerR, DNA binding
MMRFIARARHLGFSIEDIKSFIALYLDRARPSRVVMAVSAERPPADRRPSRLGEKLSQVERPGLFCRFRGGGGRRLIGQAANVGKKEYLGREAGLFRYPIG